jgi:PUA domain protein
MSRKPRRYALKSKESKQLLAQVSEKLNVNMESLFGSNLFLEVAEAEFGEVLLINGKPTLFRTKDAIVPTLTATEVIATLPKAIVDMGAVRFVCNGADVMAPGIVRYEGNFSKGDAIVVVDVKHGKPLAIGETMLGLEDAKVTKQGPVIKSKHYVSDKIWDFIKTMAE